MPVRVFGASILFMIAAACSGNDVTPVALLPVARVVVTAPVQLVEAGTVMNVTATLTDANGAPLVDRDVTWTSSDSAVATVSATGKRAAAVTGVRPGAVTISAKVEGITGSVSLGTIPSKGKGLTPQQAFIYSDDAGIFALPNFPAATSSAATGISNSGFVVGTFVLAGANHAFLWRDDIDLTDLGMLPGATDAFATAVNDSAIVVGYSVIPSFPGSSLSAQPHPFRWNGNTGGMVELSLPANASGGQATGINNAGEVSGRVSYLISGSLVSRPVRWSRDGVVEELGTPADDSEGAASAINENGDIVGYASDGYYYLSHVRAMIWHRGSQAAVIEDCGPDCIADGHSISGNGKVAGLRIDHGFVWAAANGVVDFPSLPGALYSEARGINNAGEVIINNFYPAGPRASVGTAPGSTHDLGALSGKFYTTALAINNNGQVVGFAQ